MKKIILVLIICFCLSSVVGCDNTKNNANDSNKYEGRIEINFNDSKFADYTYYDKNKNDISEYDLSEISVLYYYELEKFVSLRNNQYYVTITDSNNNVVNELSSNMEEGIYNITFTHFEFFASKLIKFEVIESKNNDNMENINGIPNESNFLKIKAGMAPDEVHHLMGKPDDIENNEYFEFQYWFEGATSIEDAQEKFEKGKAIRYYCVIFFAEDKITFVV